MLDGEDRRAKTFEEADLKALIEAYAAMDNDLIGVRQEMRRCLQEVDLHAYHQPDVTGEREGRAERRLREIRAEMVAIAEVYRAYLERIIELWTVLFDSGSAPPSSFVRKTNTKIGR